MAGESIRFNASLNTAGFDSGAKNLQNIAAQASAGIGRHFGKIATAVVGIGAAFIGIRAAVQSFNAAIAMGGALNDLSARTGETAGNLAILQRAFQNAGAGAEAVGPTINRLQRAIVEAGEGSKEQAKAFEKLGIDLDDIRRKTPTEQLRAVATALQAVGNDSDRSAIAMQLLGRSGGELLPLLRAMGVELDTARSQLGSLPGVMDRTNQALDTIGDNLAAIGEKGKEFMVGLLEQLAPGLADLTTRLANIDAAGFGAKLSEYARRTVDWVTETFRLKDALNQIEVAINGITSGNFGDGFKLLFLTARDTAFNAINEIVAMGMAAISTIGQALSAIFDSNSTTMAFIRGSFNMLGAQLASGIFDSIAGVLEKIPFIGAAAAAVRESQKEAEQAVKDIANIMYYEADNLKSEWAGVMAEAPKNFADAYNQFAASPLIDMKDRTAETAEQMERVARATRAAAFDAEKFGESLRGAQVDRLAGISGGSGSTMGSNPQDHKFPWQGAGPSGPSAPPPAEPAPAPQSSRSAPAEKEMTNLDILRESGKTDPRARAEMMRLQNEQGRAMERANSLRERGFYASAAQAEIRAERRAEARADKFAAIKLATDQYGGSNMGEAFRNMRDKTSFAGSQRDFEKSLLEQVKTEKEREQEAEANGRGSSGGDGGGGKDPAAELATKLDNVIKLMTERLPIRVLAA